MFKIEEQLANAVLQYLASRPYGEVFQLIAALTKLEKVEEKPVEEKKK